MEKIYTNSNAKRYANSKQKKTGIAILIAEKRAFKTKIVISIKEKHFIMIKGSIHQEEITCT